LVNSPELHSGKLYYPFEALSFVPFLKRFVIPLLPKDSHAWMNLDAPERGERFEYAVEAALKRTRHEFDQTVAGLSSGQVAFGPGEILRLRQETLRQAQDSALDSVVNISAYPLPFPACQVALARVKSPLIRNWRRMV